MYKQHKDSMFLYFFNGIFFLWLKASITAINTTDVSIKLFFPLNMYPLTEAIQHYSITESYQFEHLLDFTSNLSELKIIFTRTHYNKWHI